MHVPGRAVQSTITTLHCAAPDPYAGSSGLVIDSPQARRRPLTIRGPLRDRLGVLAELLHLAWLLDQPAAAPVLEPHRLGRPESYTAAVSARPVLTRLRTTRAPLTTAMDALLS